MNDHTLQVLEWDKVLNLIAAHASSDLGREYCYELQPTVELPEALRWQQQTREVKQFLEEGDPIPMAGVKDQRPIIEQLRVGATLGVLELLDVARFLGVSRRLRQFAQERSQQAPMFWLLVEPIAVLTDLEKRILDLIDPEAETVRDKASYKLAQARKQISQIQERLKAKLDSLLRANTPYLQEALVTVRNDRFVLPVRTDAQNAVPGIVHDISASGQTVYVEPLAVLELNNQLRRACLEEQAEIERILAELSEAVAEKADELGWAVEIVKEADGILAKARYSLAVNGSEPELTDDRSMELHQVRHPLLIAHSPRAVPIDVELGKSFTTMIITGPNTGGKTVTLKTIGLSCLMAQAGIQLPARPGSRLALFRKIFVDIGDEQSIQQNLSTFSSHQKQIIQILGEVDGGALVLLDEVGAGTDPTEGAALAQAIIEQIHTAGARLVVTTHFGELKQMAYREDGIANAKVDFDQVTLTPTYHLLIGQPGQSNAFEIAGRLGMPQGVIERARSLMEPEQRQMEDMFTQLAREQKALHQEREVASTARQEVEKLRRELADRMEEWNEERHRLKEQGRTEIRREVAQAKEQIAGIIRDLQQSHTAQAAQKAHNQLQSLSRSTLTRTGPLPPLEPPLKDLSVGQRVYIPRLQQQGELLTLPTDKGEVQVQLGSLKLTARVEELAPVPAGAVGPRPSWDERPRRTKLPPNLQGRQPYTADECDLRGLTADEALFVADQFLDEVFRVGLPQAYLIHGRGTGVLRRAIHEMLESHPNVASFRLGRSDEGGDGVTVVRFS